jgi:DNA-binding NtrC family response regulator
MKKKILSDEVKEFLLNYKYPGNIRELENIIERAYALTREDTIFMRDLPFKSGSGDLHTEELGQLPVKNGISVIEEMKKRMEMDIINRALSEYSDISNEKLAEMLGTSRRILELRMKEYGISKGKR